MNQHITRSHIAIVPWSPKEVAIAAEMFQLLFTDLHGEDGPLPARLLAFNVIAVRLTRTRAAVWQRFRDHGPSFNAGGAARRHISAQAMAQRDARRAAVDNASLTCQFFGDPPPGYSALDRRKAQCGNGAGTGSGTGRR